VGFVFLRLSRCVRHPVLDCGDGVTKGAAGLGRGEHWERDQLLARLVSLLVGDGVASLDWELGQKLWLRSGALPVGNGMAEYDAGSLRFRC
jgi:hypothetical protein